jgi:hypothetical protein
MKNFKIKGYVSLAALVAGLASPVVAQDNQFGIQYGGGQSAADIAAELAQELENSGDAREIDQEPIDGINAPAYRYVQTEPGVGGPGDMFNVTNIDNYETTVAGSVYSPTLSTENVNKLYVDNTINYLTQSFKTEIFNIKQDV